MAVPFSRTIRSLQADNFRLSLIGLVMAIVLLLLWLAWFVFAQVTLYEISGPVQILPDGLVKVDFPQETSSRVKHGQPALLKLDGEAGTELGPLPAVVTEVTRQAETNMVQAQLFVFWPPFFQPTNDLAGRIEVEVEHIAPATLVLRTASGFLDSTPIRVSPQQSPASKSGP